MIPFILTKGQMKKGQIEFGGKITSFTSQHWTDFVLPYKLLFQ